MATQNTTEKKQNSLMCIDVTGKTGIELISLQIAVIGGFKAQNMTVNTFVGKGVKDASKSYLMVFPS